MRDPIKVPGDVQKVRIEHYTLIKLSVDGRNAYY